MPPLQLRQEFPSLKAFKEALHQWAIEAHFEPRILKSDTGRVRVGCKRDPNCPFVIRCNWERKQNRQPLARVTVLKEKHTCLNGVEWLNAAAQQGAMLVPPGGGGNGNGTLNGGMNGALNTIEIRQDEDGNIVGGARVLGPIEGRRSTSQPQMVPVLPKVQRNSASRLPFLMEILPRLMNITKETTPVEIRECLLREYGAEVHLQQCRRAKTEILKKLTGEDEEMGQSHSQGSGQGQQQPVFSQPRAPIPEMRAPPPQQQILDGMSEENDAQQLFGDIHPNLNGNQTQSTFTLHPGSGVGTPVMPRRPSAALHTNGDAPVRCPYCINHRWMKSIKDAVDHMSMHVVV
ncbi:hypothetical protein D0Z07_0290 [Hyphodiscus hymeniophilus]|uniref:Transposase MuDR plant domain-containing protein n=1 Tax=Hyphodiscus hymeniophilus TaxID=353542 RepID=A0A9P6VRU9_9HELO|nr:hypothetical protein D0Z07_0290 [Hyphodiscus hymeniophilus]